MRDECNNRGMVLISISQKCNPENQEYIIKEKSVKLTSGKRKRKVT